MIAVIEPTTNSYYDIIGLSQKDAKDKSLYD
jgi:hypothetical protein